MSQNKFETIIIDNGSHKIHAGLSSNKLSTPEIIYENLKAIDKKTGTIYYGEKIDEIIDEYNYNFVKPTCRGIIVNFDSETSIWERIFKKLMNLENKSNFNQTDFANVNLMLTVQMFTPNEILKRIFEIFLEYYNFKGFFPINPQNAIQKYLQFIYKENNYSEVLELINNDNNKKVFVDESMKVFQILINSSNSATYINPFFDKELVNYAVKKIDVGGKLLTNYLKESISFQQLNLQNEYKLVNQIKEDLCYVSLDFKNEMKK